MLIPYDIIIKWKEFVEGKTLIETYYLSKKCPSERMEKTIYKKGT